MLDVCREPLVWAGQPIGGGGGGGGETRPVRVTNTSPTDCIRVVLEIADGTAFQFQELTGQEPGRLLELALPPGSESEVPVAFIPSAAACFRDSVFVRQPDHPTAAAVTVSLCGYGGSSNVQISVVNSRVPCQPGQPPTLVLNMTAPDGSLLAGLMITNQGARAAYVRLLIFTELACRDQLPEGVAAAMPSRFVLPAGETQQLTVAAPPRPPIPGARLTVMVLCGDELLRRELRHAWPAGAPVAPRAPSHFQLIQFQETFDAERQETCPELPLGFPPRKLDDIFFKNMRQSKLPLIYPDKVPEATAAAGRARLQEMQPAATPTRTVTFGRASGSTPVSPLRAAAAAGGSPTTSGGSPARPTASPSRTKGSPRKRSAPPLPPPPPPPAPPAGGACAVSEEDWWPDGPGTEQVVSEGGRPRVRLSTSHLVFPMTALGVPSEAALQLTNLCAEPLTWNILGYSVPYLVKGAHPDKMKKCGYDVFKIRPKEGEVEAGQSICLQVRFSPPYPGKLTQHFQLLCKPSKPETEGQPMVVYTVPVRVSGRGSVLDDGEEEADLLTTPLHVSDHSYYFDHWSTSHKLDVTNKTGEDLEVEYHVTGPFKVVSGPNERSQSELTEGRMLAPSQRYVQMSVYFCPETVGEHSGLLRLWLGHAPWHHEVHLAGTCNPGDAETLRENQLAGEL